MNIYLGNIPYNTTEAEVYNLLTSMGTVNDLNYPRDRVTGSHRGFAFVTVQDEEDAETMIDKLNDATLGGRDLRASEAKADESTSNTQATMPVGFRKQGENPFGGFGGRRR